MNCVIPEKLGLVFDPSAPPVFSKNQGAFSFKKNTLFLSHICDQLLIYDCILLRCDQGIISSMYSGISCEELEPLFKNKKILFFAPVSGEFYGVPKLESNNGSIDRKYIASLEEYLKPLEIMLASSINDIVNQVDNYSVENQVVNTDLSEDIIEKFLSSFHKGAIDLLPHPEKTIWHKVGFSSGIGTIVDIWSTGTFNIHFDYEMEHNLKKCTSLQSEFSGKLLSHQDNIIESLHSVGNLPSIKTQIFYEQLTTKDFVRLVLSDEVHDLQKWLRENIVPGLDVRDFYYKSLANLPSKSNWAKWLRFGSATLLSSVLGLFISGNPALAALLGVGVGVADTASGDNLTELLFDPYHPRDYLGYFTDKL